MFKEYPDVMTCKQAANALQIGMNKIYELTNSGAIKNIRVGNKHLIPKLYLIEFVTAVEA